MCSCICLISSITLVFRLSLKNLWDHCLLLVQWKSIREKSEKIFFFHSISEELVVAKFLEIIVRTAHTEHSIAGVEQISLRITYHRFSGYCGIKCRNLRRVPTQRGAACFWGRWGWVLSSVLWAQHEMARLTARRCSGGFGVLFTVTQTEKERKIYVIVELRSCKRTRLGLAPRSQHGYGLGQEAERKKVGNLDWKSQGCTCKEIGVGWGLWVGKNLREAFVMASVRWGPKLILL